MGELSNWNIEPIESNPENSNIINNSSLEDPL